MDRNSNIRYMFLNRCISLFFSVSLLYLLLAPVKVFSQTGYSAKFIFSAEEINGGTIYSTSGDILVCGGKYRVEIPEELLIVCNGEVQWMYNPMNEDIVISKSEISKHLSQSANPGAIADILVALFASEGDSGSKAEIKRDKTGNPVEILLYSDKNLYRVKAGTFNVEENVPQDTFVFNVKKYPEAIVTDMR